jgi:hypothetical protein
MYFMISVAALCAVLLIAGLVREACRHRPDLWITSDDAILCVVSPALILLGTFGAVALGHRLTHGGLAAVSVAAWIGSAAIAATSFAIWAFVVARLRKGRRAAIAPSGSAPATL